MANSVRRKPPSDKGTPDNEAQPPPDGASSREACTPSDTGTLDHEAQPPPDDAASVREAYRMRALNLASHLKTLALTIEASRSLPADVQREIDAFTTARFAGWSSNRAARVELLHAIDQVLADDERRKTALAFMRRARKKPLSDEEANLTEHPPPHARRLAEVMAQRVESFTSPEQQIEANNLEKIYDQNEAEPDDVHHMFARWCPDHVLQLKDDDLRVALRTWKVRGTRKTAKERPLKWPHLAEMMERAGLGKVSPSTLEQDWIAWRRLGRAPSR